MAVCRGGPGLGRVVPAYGLVQTLRARCHVDALFVSYGAGYAYLRRIGEQTVDLGPPAGLFIDSVSRQALEVERLATTNAPDLILMDGEFFLPATLAHLPFPVVYIANPHDLTGPLNVFRRVNRLLLAHCHAVVVSALSCRSAQFIDLIPGVPCLEVPPITKPCPTLPATPNVSPRVLVSMGGGSMGVDSAFREATDQALEVTLDVLIELNAKGSIGSATVVLGADGIYARSVSPSWLTVVTGPVELTDLYASHDAFIARAGRNACAEALCCGIPSVFLPIVADPHRGSEQMSNAESAAAQSPDIFAASGWRNRASLRSAIESALSQTSLPRTSAGRRGNDDAASFVIGLISRRCEPKGTLKTEERMEL